MFSQGWDGFVCPISLRLRGHYERWGRKIYELEEGRVYEMLFSGIDMTVLHGAVNCVCVHLGGT